MGAHLVNGTFQSDKYPSCPLGKVPLSVKDPTAQDLLWEYAQRRRKVDSEFSDDLETALKNAGYDPGALSAEIRERVRSSIAAARDAMADAMKRQGRKLIGGQSGESE